MDDEILEVGEDGVFEITSTKTVKQVTIAQPNYDDVKFNDDEEELAHKEELLNSINPGEYKIYKSSGFVFILMKLNDGDIVHKVSSTPQEISVETKLHPKLIISLRNIDPISSKSGTCTAWKDYVTLKYALI